MLTLREKRNKLALIEEIILNEQFGLYNVCKNINFIMPELSKIKKILLQKSNEKSNYEKELYYTICVKINLNNYLDYFKLLDQHIQKKKREGKTSSNKKYTFAPRKRQEIVVGAKEIPISLKERLKKYIYLQTSNPGSVAIYLRTKKEYEENLFELKEINKELNNLNIKLTINIICESNIIKNMKPMEKKEFIEFLKDY